LCIQGYKELGDSSKAKLVESSGYTFNDKPLIHELINL